MKTSIAVLFVSISPPPDMILDIDDVFFAAGVDTTVLVDFETFALTDWGGGVRDSTRTISAGYSAYPTWNSPEKRVATNGSRFISFRYGRTGDSCSASLELQHVSVLDLSGFDTFGFLARLSRY